jgi:hypothetical protein
MTIATGKTFELRRDESDDAAGVDPAATLPALLAPLIADSDRAVKGVVPFPFAQEPAPPATKERVAEILADPRVKAQQARDGRGAD